MRGLVRIACMEDHRCRGVVLSTMDLPNTHSIKFIMFIQATAVAFKIDQSTIIFNCAIGTINKLLIQISCKSIEQQMNITRSILLLHIQCEIMKDLLGGYNNLD